MELRQLKYFVGIVDSGCFSDASRALFVSQSAISQQIKALEEELGTQLFIRNTHCVSLTESGRELLPLARSILSGVDECRVKMSSLKDLLCGELNIGLTFMMEPYVREAMLMFMKKHPHVMLNAHYRSLPELLQKLQDHKIDVMFSMMPISNVEFVESEPLLEYRLMAVMRSTHPLAERELLTFDDIRKQSLIMPERGVRNLNALEYMLHVETGDLNICSYVNDANAILNLLQESNCISILAEHTVNNRPLLNAVSIAELNQPIKIFAHFNNDANRKHSAQVFLDLLRNTTAYYLTTNKLE